MKSLVSLVFDITEIERQIVQGDGVLPPELEAKFDLTTGDIKTKVDAYRVITDAFEARAVYFKERADQMLHAKKLFDNQKNRLKENIKFAMHTMGVSDLEGNDWRYKLSRGRDKLTINEDELPPEYFKKVESMEPDRDLIERELLLGKTIPGTKLEPSETLRSYVNTVGRSKIVKEIEE